MDRQSNSLCAVLRSRLSGGKARIPEGSAVIWSAFLDLSRARSIGSAGPNPVSLPEIEAWCRLMRVPLEPQHVRILLDLDRVWIEHAYARSAGTPDGVKTLPKGSGQPISAALFDAAFG